MKRIPPTFRRLAVAAHLLLVSYVHSAPPTPKDDQQVAGEWMVHSPIGVRLYEIKPNRNLKIVGSGLKDKTGKMRPSEDGSYVADVEGAILRLIHLKDTDQLTVEYYASQKDIDRKLPPGWKTNASRKPAQKQ